MKAYWGKQYECSVLPLNCVWNTLAGHKLCKTINPAILYHRRSSLTFTWWINEMAGKRELQWAAKLRSRATKMWMIKSIFSVLRSMWIMSSVLRSPMMNYDTPWKRCVFKFLLLFLFSCIFKFSKNRFLTSLISIMHLWIPFSGYKICKKNCWNLFHMLL